MCHLGRGVADHEPGRKITQRGGEHSRVRSYLFPVRQWNNIYFISSQDLSFVECLQLHPETADVVCGYGKDGAGEVTLIQPFEWKGVLP